MSSNVSITLLSENVIDVTAALYDLSQIAKDYTDYQFDIDSTQVVSPSTIIHRVSFIEKLFTIGTNGLLKRNENRKSKSFVVMTNSLDQSIEIEDFNRIPLKGGLYSLHIMGSAYANNEDDVTVNDVFSKFIETVIPTKDVSIVMRDDILDTSNVVYNKDYLLTTLQKTFEE